MIYVRVVKMIMKRNRKCCNAGLDETNEATVNISSNEPKTVLFTACHNVIRDGVVDPPPQLFFSLTHQQSLRRWGAIRRRILIRLKAFDFLEISVGAIMAVIVKGLVFSLPPATLLLSGAPPPQPPVVVTYLDSLTTDVVSVAARPCLPWI